jgi:hypothetical protein
VCILQTQYDPCRDNTHPPDTLLPGIENHNSPGPWCNATRLYPSSPRLSRFRDIVNVATSSDAPLAKIIHCLPYQSYDVCGRCMYGSLHAVGYKNREPNIRYYLPIQDNAFPSFRGVHSDLPDVAYHSVMHREAGLWPTRRGLSFSNGPPPQSRVVQRGPSIS